MKISRRQLRLIIEQASAVKKSSGPSLTSSKGVAGTTKGNPKVMKAYKLLGDAGRAFSALDGELSEFIAEICFALEEAKDPDLAKELEAISNKLSGLTDNPEA